MVYKGSNRLVLLFFGFCGAFSLSSFSQTIILDAQKIVWEGVKPYQITEDKFEDFLFFKGASYNPENIFIPAFQKTIKLNNNVKNVFIKLIDPVFEPSSIIEQSYLKSKAFSFTDVLIKNKINKSQGDYYLDINFIPLRYNNGRYEKLVSFGLEIDYDAAISTSKFSQPSLQSSYASVSVLSTGQWYKIGITKSGIYKMDYTFFKSMGLNVSGIDPKNIKVYGNGGGMLPFSNAAARYDDLQENAIEVIGESDGAFNQGDYVLFYGKGPHTWSYNTADNKFHHKANYFTDTAYYFITADLGLGKRITSQSSSLLSPTHNVIDFDDYNYIEHDNENLIKSGREWYGDKLDINSSQDFNFIFPNLSTSKPVYIKTDIASRYDQPSQNDVFKVSAENAFINLSPGPCNFSNYTADFATTAVGSFTFIASSSAVNVTVSKNLSRAIGWINYVEINARRQLIMYGSEMIFRDAESVGTGNVADFNLSGANTNVKIWDITDPVNVKLQQTNISGSNLNFRMNTDVLKEFVAFTGASYFTPKYIGIVPNQNLHATKQQDMIIVSHPLFLNQANRLADLHRTKDNLKVTVVTTQEVYNEFASGAQDICAIRGFMKMLYDRAMGNTDSLPKYLLLFGDGSYDMKYRFAGNTNFIPSFESANSVSYINSYVSDDFFGLMDDAEGDLDAGGAVDIGVGRFPVKSIQEAKTVVDKIIRYTGTNNIQTTEQTTCSTSTNTSLGEWRNTMCFIGDDEDGNQHVNDANTLADFIQSKDTSYNLDKIFLDAYVQEATPGGDRYPNAVEAINRRMDKGGLIVSYSGHGGEVGLAHERIIQVPQINDWKNAYKLPLFITGTCEFSRFDDPARTSAGELILLNPNGGGIGLLTTVRLTYGNSNTALSMNFYKHFYDTLSNGEKTRIGDIVRKAKVLTGSSINNRVFSLLCDPALRLAYPTYKIQTSLLSQDTLKAVATLTVTGYVKDKYGNKLTDYNGILYPTIFDKEVTTTTLANDAGSSPYPFKEQKNILYKGKVSVINGDFSFSFVVPKDVAGETYGKGKISYYTDNGVEDGNGYYDNIVIGGTSANALNDITGPELKLYLNDTKFVFGGTTNEAPYLYAEIKDENGINTSGIGIGHDITAVLDGNTAKALVLNDYYEADLNSYKSGKIKFPLTSLSEGTHTLKLKVWDVYNNSSEAYTEFVVAPKADVALKHVLNYPNPFTTNTAFYFEHNQACEQIDVQIQVFTVSGKIVKTILENVQSIGYRSSAVYWDGKDDYGDKLAKGVYIYRIKVKTADNRTAEQYEKLVIL